MSLVEFEKHKVVKSFMEACDVYYTNLGGYHYSKDRSTCYYLNGMLTMFEEQQKKIDLLETELNETQAFLNKQNHVKQTKIDELNERNSEEKRILHNVIEMNQAKIDELKKLRSLDEMEINQLAQANQVWQIKCDELQKRIDDASNKIDFWAGGKNGDAIHVAKSIGNILKGNKDEN